MKSFTYTIVDPVGIHARPAGLLVKTAKAFSGTETSVTKGDKDRQEHPAEELWAWGSREATPSPSPPRGRTRTAPSPPWNSFLRRIYKRAPCPRSV